MELELYENGAIGTWIENANIYWHEDGGIKVFGKLNGHGVIRLI